jgi:hypothetical protein
MIVTVQHQPINIPRVLQPIYIYHPKVGNAVSVLLKNVKQYKSTPFKM